MTKAEIAACFNTSMYSMEQESKSAFDIGQTFDLSSRTTPFWRIDGLEDKMKRAKDLVDSLKNDCDAIVQALAAPQIQVAVAEAKKKK